MATMQKTKGPSWWKKDYDSAWDRIKAAFQRDWEQTKHDFGGKAPDLNQDVPDTVKQAAGKQQIPPPSVPNFEEVEDASRFGYGARQYYQSKHPQWNQQLEDQLRRDWEAGGHSADDWSHHRTAIRRGWEYTEN